MTLRTIAVAVALSGVALTGCGGLELSTAAPVTHVTTAPVSGPRTGDAYIALVDVSPSTAKARPTYIDDLSAVAAQAAGARGPLYADAFDGAPQERIRWSVHQDFATVPRPYDANAELTGRYLGQRAAELRPALEALLKSRPTTSGTPLGPVLASAAGLCGQQRGKHCRIYVFTDGVFIGPEFDARRPLTLAGRRRLAARWRTRLAGLEGAEVRFVGVGYGSRAGQRTLQNSRRAAEALVTAAGGRVADWNVRLAPGA